MATINAEEILGKLAEDVCDGLQEGYNGGYTLSKWEVSLFKQTFVLQRQVELVRPFTLKSSMMELLMNTPGSKVVGVGAMFAPSTPVTTVLEVAADGFDADKTEMFIKDDVGRLVPRKIKQSVLEQFKALNKEKFTTAAQASLAATVRYVVDTNLRRLFCPDVLPGVIMSSSINSIAVERFNYDADSQQATCKIVFSIAAQEAMQWTHHSVQAIKSIDPAVDRVECSLSRQYHTDTLVLEIFLRVPRGSTFGWKQFLEIKPDLSAASNSVRGLGEPFSRQRKMGDEAGAVTSTAREVRSNLNASYAVAVNRSRRLQKQKSRRPQLVNEDAPSDSASHAEPTQSQTVVSVAEFLG